MAGLKRLGDWVFLRAICFSGVWEISANFGLQEPADAFPAGCGWLGTIVYLKLLLDEVSRGGASTVFHSIEG